MTQPVLQIDRLTVLLNTDEGPAPVVRDLSLSVHEGGTLGIVGESGCGKSMTALAVMRLLPEFAQVSGRILLQGEDLLLLDERAMCGVRGGRIGMVFQEPMTALNPAHGIGRQVAESLRVHRRMDSAAAWAEAARLLDLVGIDHARGRMRDYPHQLSGGQRQRVVIAIALACRPVLLIADEPTTALDVTVQAQILDLLDRLVAELGMALVLISHDLGVVGRLCDDVVVMYAGEAVEHGPTARVFDALAHPYTRGLFGALPGALVRPGGRLQTIAGVVPSPLQLPRGCKFANRCELAVDACSGSAPTLHDLGAGHAARCIRIGARQHG
jgi:peptide/nickel transport system ATP-binding protein